MTQSDDLPLLTGLFNPGDRVRIMDGKYLGKTGTVVEIKGDRVVVLGDSGQKRVMFKPGSLVIIPPQGSVVGELDDMLSSTSIPPRVYSTKVSVTQAGADLDDLLLSEQISSAGHTPWKPPSSGEQRSPTLGNSVPDLGEQRSPTLGNSVPDLGEQRSPTLGNSVPDLGEQRSPTLGNSVPDLGGNYAELVQVLHSAAAHLRSRAPLTNRWLCDSDGERTRYRLRWREDGVLKSEEIPKEAIAGYRDRIRAGELLKHVEALLKLLMESS